MSSKMSENVEDSGRKIDVQRVLRPRE